VKIEGELFQGWFLSRDNRFRVTVEISGQKQWAHLANSGRLRELLVSGRRVLLTERAGRKRKTHYDLSLVEMDGHWVSLDARLPNNLVDEALRNGQIPPLSGYSDVRREVTFGSSRLDFLLKAPDRRPCLVEVKSVTLVIDGLGCFPDAITLRGQRHVNELATVAASGYRAAVIFVVQRDDATGVRPHDESDPEFGRALRKAAGQGVEVLACACQVEPGCIQIERTLPVYLD
jgi:sugar fermentation stimulation protein A